MVTSAGPRDSKGEVVVCLHGLPRRAIVHRMGEWRNRRAGYGWTAGWAWTFGNSSICAGNPPKQPNFAPAHSAQVQTVECGPMGLAELQATMPTCFLHATGEPT
jgi:hypothetical protein